MRKFVPGLFLLIAVAALRPASAIALECGLHPADSGVHDAIAGFGDPLASNRVMVLRAAAGGPSQRDLDTGRYERVDQTARSQPGNEPAAWNDRPAKTGSRQSSVIARSANGGGAEPGAAAVRSIPEPGHWGILVAGFLGIITVARRRIFSD